MSAAHAPLALQQLEQELAMHQANAAHYKRTNDSRLPLTLARVRSAEARIKTLRGQIPAEPETAAATSAQ